MKKKRKFIRISGLLNILIIRTILFKHWEIYGKNSFFMVYSTDCIISFVMISIDIVVRMFTYFTPLCPVLAPYFFEPLIVFKVIMIIINHSKASKSIIQIFLVLNRMSCVLYPLKYSLMWKKPVKLVIVSIFVIPFTTDWNLIISRVYMQPTFGGFYMEYIKKVSWVNDWLLTIDRLQIYKLSGRTVSFSTFFHFHCVDFHCDLHINHILFSDYFTKKNQKCWKVSFICNCLHFNEFHCSSCFSGMIFQVSDGNYFSNSDPICILFVNIHNKCCFWIRPPFLWYFECWVCFYLFSTRNNCQIIQFTYHFDLRQPEITLPCVRTSVQKTSSGTCILYDG